ncbi:MAG: hypothetical protein L3J37_08745 [Rhodobacteraceae bacterium]|nr:hypothetical protein [Paracoccaceae bacterium]
MNDSAADMAMTAVNMVGAGIAPSKVTFGYKFTVNGQDYVYKMIVDANKLGAPGDAFASADHILIGAGIVDASGGVSSTGNAWVAGYNPETETVSAGYRPFDINATVGELVPGGGTLDNILPDFIKDANITANARVGIYVGDLPDGGLGSVDVTPKGEVGISFARPSSSPDADAGQKKAMAREMVDKFGDQLLDTVLGSGTAASLEAIEAAADVAAVAALLGGGNVPLAASLYLAKKQAINAIKDQAAEVLAALPNGELTGGFVYSESATIGFDGEVEADNPGHINEISNFLGEVESAIEGLVKEVSDEQAPWYDFLEKLKFWEDDEEGAVVEPPEILITDLDDIFVPELDDIFVPEYDPEDAEEFTRNDSYNDIFSGMLSTPRDADNVISGSGGATKVSWGYIYESVTLTGTAGNDWINSSNGDDILSGGAGSDNIRSAGGYNIGYGGPGNDFIIFDSRSDSSIIMGPGHPDWNGLTFVDEDGEVYYERQYKGSTFYGGSGNDILRGGSGNDTLYGGSGVDLLISTGGDNRLYGGAGDDFLSGSHFASSNRWFDHSSRGNYIDGGDGIDTVYYWKPMDSSRAILEGYEAYDNYNIVAVGPNSYEVSLVNGNGRIDTLVNVEKLVFISNTSGISIMHASRNYSIDLAEYTGNTAVPDTNPPVPDSANADKAELEKVYNRLFSNENIDEQYELFGDKGIEWLFGDDGANALFGGDSSGTIQGNANTETLYGDAANNRIYGNEGNDNLYGGGGSDYLSGGSGGDALYGGGDRDVLSGGAGNDTLYGGYGNDRIYGGADDDLLSGEGGDDKIYGGDGDDTLNGQNGNDALYGDAGNDKLYGGNGNDLLTGGDGNDELHGGAGGDMLRGNAGNDEIYGDAGGDSIAGGAGNDKLYGGASNDWIGGDAGNDRIYGGDGNDSLVGGAGNDSINGGSGRDRIEAGTGDDYMNGGTGDYADTFVFSLNDGNDRIGGFQDGLDKIEFDEAGMTFDDLQIVNTRIGTLILTDASDAILLIRVDASLITADDFIFSG